MYFRIDIRYIHVRFNDFAVIKFLLIMIFYLTPKSRYSVHTPTIPVYRSQN